MFLPDHFYKWALAAILAANVAEAEKELHSSPASRIWTCHKCGGSFELPGGTMADQCPHCGFKGKEGHKGIACKHCGGLYVVQPGTACPKCGHMLCD